jgi:thiazole synthase
MGADAVLVNTAIAAAADPVAMAAAFRRASRPGRLPYEAGLPGAAAGRGGGGDTSPLTAFPDGSHLKFFP